MLANLPVQLHHLSGDVIVRVVGVTGAVLVDCILELVLSLFEFTTAISGLRISVKNAPKSGSSSKFVDTTAIIELE